LWPEKADTEHKCANIGRTASFEKGHEQIGILHAGSGWRQQFLHLARGSHLGAAVRQVCFEWGMLDPKLEANSEYPKLTVLDI
jgi:hypothetical protein